MSRFFAASSSDSDSDSDSDDRSLTSDSQFQSDSERSTISSQSEKGPKFGGKGGKWLKRDHGGSDSDESSSDEEGDGKKVVKSARDKKFDELRSYVKVLLNSLKIRDWLSVQNEFDKLQKGIARADTMVQKEGIPRFYIRAFISLEDVMNNALNDKEAIKKMNPSTSKAFNAMKQKIKKESKLREVEIAKFKEDPVDELDSADEADELAEQRAAALNAPKKSVVIHAPGDTEGFVEVGKGGKSIGDFSTVNVFEKLAEVMDARGKKNTDKLAQIDTLAELMHAVKSPFQTICVLNALVATRFDYVPPVSGCMATEMWKHALAEIKQLYDYLDQYPNITISGTVDMDDEETDASKDKRVVDGGEVAIRGNVAAFVDRLDDEFFKSLQAMDPNTTEYTERLRDETSLYSMIVRAQKYAETKQADQDILDMMLMRRVEHLYYKPDAIIQSIEEAVRKEYPQLKDQLENPDNLVWSICTSLYKTNIDRIRTRALLCQVYHLALRDQFHDAKNTILMSHLQESISQTDVATQTLFNRTIVQIGLCAFRNGFFKDAHSILQEISSSGKTKELLAQGISMQKYAERTPEQEKLDKSRQLPFHMHVNLELLECVYLVSAMLLEIPNMAQHTHDSRRKMISKQFRRMLEYSERQVFQGPPENNRDHIMAAAKAMAIGNWQDATQFISGIKVWDYLLSHKEEVISMLSLAIQEESLRTYIFTYSPYYESFGIASLASMFSLPTSRVKSIVSKMIYQDSLCAHLDAGDEYILIDGTASNTRIDYLVGYLADKVSVFADANDKLVEAKNLASGAIDQKRTHGQRKMAK